MHAFDHHLCHHGQQQDVLLLLTLYPLASPVLLFSFANAANVAPHLHVCTRSY
jgi:hypothetical protein